MKKLFSLLFVAGALSIISCGPNAADEAKAKAAAQATMDSLFKVNAAGMSTPDSTAAATTTPDSTAAATTK